MDDYTIVKRDHQGVVKLRYNGNVIRRTTEWVCIRALFNFDRVDMGFVAFERDDVFTEWFYADRWYNVFRVQHGRSGQLKGWYCNITRPARIEVAQVAADDLALDVFVHPDGQIRLLDEDEFDALQLPGHEQSAAWSAVARIERLVQSWQGPFDAANAGHSP